MLEEIEVPKCRRGNVIGQMWAGLLIILMVGGIVSKNVMVCVAAGCLLIATARFLNCDKER